MEWLLFILKVCGIQIQWTFSEKTSRRLPVVVDAEGMFLFVDPTHEVGRRIFASLLNQLLMDPSFLGIPGLLDSSSPPQDREGVSVSVETVMVLGQPDCEAPPFWEEIISPLRSLTDTDKADLIRRVEEWRQTSPAPRRDPVRIFTEGQKKLPPKIKVGKKPVALPDIATEGREGELSGNNVIQLPTPRRPERKGREFVGGRCAGRQRRG